MILAASLLMCGCQNAKPIPLSRAVYYNNWTPSGYQDLMIVITYKSRPQQVIYFGNPINDMYIAQLPDRIEAKP